MKNLLLIAMLLCSFSFAGISQSHFGAGLVYTNDLGVQARARINTGSFDVIPKVSYYFVENVTALSFDLDAAYNLLYVGDENPLYLFAGPTYYRASSSGFSDGNIGINLGTGIEVSHFYGEIRYTGLFCEECGGDIGFAAGYNF